MFGKRPNAKKPAEGLINKFQESFSDVVRPTTSKPPARPAINENFLNHDTAAQPNPSLRFTPFLDDLALPSPRNQAYQEYMSGGSNTVFHGPAGDLHTPSVETKLITPNTLLERFAVTPLHRNNIDTIYGNLDPQYFVQDPQGTTLGNPSAAYPPSAFVHSNIIDGFVNDSSEQLPPVYGDDLGHFASQLISPGTVFPKVERSPSYGHADFRYNVTLNTPTAMIHNPNDAPVTYLNKGHTYSLSITDSRPPPWTEGLVKYRTSIRISFEESDHASSPAACWSLWKDSRSREVLQTNGILKAVEMVDLGKRNEGQIYPIQLDRTSLDGFCVTWLGDPSKGPPGCTIGVRFNFLSTDFSHSKGVKGAPLRLCAKTETAMPGTAELSFCIVKLFRDHGAERKMFNDVSQLTKAIEKRKQDFDKAQNGSDSLGKRKRGSRSVYSSDQLDNQFKAQLENNMDAELARMQSIFKSNRPVSRFCLAGEKQDDPDLFPIRLVDEGLQRTEQLQPVVQTVTPPSTLSSSSRDLSHSSADVQQPKSHRDPSNHQRNDCSGSSNISSGNTGSEEPSEHATTPQTDPATSVLSNEDAGPMQDDSNSKAQGQEDATRPAKCFYLRFQQNSVQQDDYHKAVYLAEPTVQELVTKISQKQKFNRDRRVDLFRVSPNGMKIILDDDVVQRIPDGQDMAVETCELATSDNMATDSGPVSSIEVRLYF
ncbi:hypothetical protein N7476_009026 [Penicillium atrosanguineum]|uniref:Grh/CP2 DB domain-containing protein n=1 Tax=Penicillium atrosanguineum TaxID=1132637 RepID=A0A9W9PSW4_9EURO|nr:hypothetical protein N7526_002226 [Penicillium atrosanguineum]KAJ5308370.1 hypothetical protein N7476_009026 [Penicillium atrosanguineum]